MPEGDTLFLTATRLREALAGRALTVTDLRVPRLATVDLTGRQVTEVFPRGKHLLIRIEDGWTLHTHLRMEGRWQVYRAGERWRGGPDWQVRAVLGNADHTAVGYRLPVLELLRTEDEPQAVGHLGPDLLGPDWDPDEALRRLRAQPDRPVGDALLDQRVMAGIGNVYRCELCFLRGVTPWTPVGEVARPERLVDLAHRALDANKLRHGHITTGDTRPGRQHWVYGRAGRPCLRCGTPVAVAERTDPSQERVTYWCPACQRGPSPAPQQPTRSTRPGPPRR
ncbi:DNA-formamidopyrimidine glycosylase family protein [Peterkaempfera bronchialis]|uniref:DNA-formamidopyrimidine glycosylase family protein n=1 Tax=Peterkaempfera bronchialis TaxID=2126346 RepID=UPI000DAB5840